MRLMGRHRSRQVCGLRERSAAVQPGVRRAARPPGGRSDGEDGYGPGRMPPLGRTRILRAHDRSRPSRAEPCRLARPGQVQGSLFDTEENQKQTGVDTTVDAIKEKFGPKAIQRGLLIENGGKGPLGLQKKRID